MKLWEMEGREPVFVVQEVDSFAFEDGLSYKPLFVTEDEAFAKTFVEEMGESDYNYIKTFKSDPTDLESVKILMSISRIRVDISKPEGQRSYRETFTSSAYKLRCDAYTDSHVLVGRMSGNRLAVTVREICDEKSEFVREKWYQDNLDDIVDYMERNSETITKEYGLEEREALVKWYEEKRYYGLREETTTL
ncbi:hypothetical protein RB298_19820 [Priestia sp. BR_2]